jgi:hypothetical protein
MAQRIERVAIRLCVYVKGVEWIVCSGRSRVFFAQACRRQILAVAHSTVVVATSHPVGKWRGMVVWKCCRRDDRSSEWNVPVKAAGAKREKQPMAVETSGVTTRGVGE